MVTLHEDMSMFMLLSERVIEWEIFQIWSEIRSTRFIYSYFLFEKSFLLCGNVENIVQSGRPQMTGNMEHSHSMLGTYGYK